MSKARERVLNAAEALFHENGYNSVSMRDIAKALGMRQASLYYHVPDGKEQLFVEVTRRGLERHQHGLTKATQEAENNIEAQLKAAARWVFSQPPMYLFKMMENDMPKLSASSQQMLMQISHQALFLPIITIFETAQNRGQTRADIDPASLTGTFLSIIEGIAFANRQTLTRMTPVEMADDVIDVILNGLRPRS